MFTRLGPALGQSGLELRGLCLLKGVFFNRLLTSFLSDPSLYFLYFGWHSRHLSFNF